MEVDRGSFWPELLSILHAISSSTFVAVDVEMSGITTKQRYGPNSRQTDANKLTLQEQYEETKSAAERYQVLQVGLTCIEENPDEGMYIARPYNFFITPLLEERDRLDIYRDITLSSSALHFLQNNKFDIGAVFERGVFYASRHEEAEARKYVVVEKEYSDIYVKADDPEALDFYRKARITIRKWAGETKPENNYVDIRTSEGLTGVQRKLVHQLIRTEFPGLKAFSKNKGAFLSVEKYSKERAKKDAKNNLTYFESRMAKQIGFRYIIEALIGGDLKQLEPHFFTEGGNRRGDPGQLDIKRKEIAIIRDSLATKRHVLVGHNLFTDLIFLYKTFIGPLPRRVQDFQSKIHEMLPLVIDTKYMATLEGGTMQKPSSLSELYSRSKDQPKPGVRTALGFDKYHNGEAFHEAGYDSWITAQVFLKLAKSLELARQPDAGAKAPETPHLLLHPAREPAPIFPDDSDSDGADAGGVVLHSRERVSSIHTSSLPVLLSSPSSHNIAASGTNGTNAGHHTNNHIHVFSNISNISGHRHNLMDTDIDGIFNASQAATTSPMRYLHEAGAPSPSTLSPRSTAEEDIWLTPVPKPRLQFPKRDRVSGNSDGRSSDVDYRNRFAVLDIHSNGNESSESANDDSEGDAGSDEGTQEPPRDDTNQWIGPLDPKREFWMIFGNKLRVFGTEKEVCALALAS